MRIRLLPVLMFALVGTITVKAGSLWNAFEVSVGSESRAQGTAPATESATPATPPPAEQSASTGEQPIAAEPTASSPEQAGAQAPEQTGEQSGEPPVEAAPATATLPPAEGGEAGVESSTVTADPGLDEQQVHDPFNYTDEEVDVLQQLAKRREELELRARQLDEREALIQAAERRMDQKMAELKALQATVEDLLAKRSDEEEAKLKSLVKMYENMKPKDAAQVFEEMDMDVLLDVVDRMSERKAAPIIALVTPTRAKEITFELAQRRALPMPE